MNILLESWLYALQQNKKIKQVISTRISNNKIQVTIKVSQLSHQSEIMPILVLLAFYIYI